MEIKEIYQYKIANTKIVFVETVQGQLKLVHFSPEEFQGIDELPEELIEAATLVEAQVTGLNQPDHKGNKLGNTLIGRNLRVKEISCQKNCIYISQTFAEGNVKLLVNTTIDSGKENDVFSWKNELVNLGEEIGLEYLTTINVTAVNGSKIFHPYIEDRLYLPHNSWQGELQWQNGTLKELGLDYWLDGEKLQDSTKTIQVTNTTSWSCAQFSPFAVLVSEATDRTTFWQIENNGEWHWELTDCGFGKYLALRAGGPTEPTNHWWKRLSKGEAFETVPAAFGVLDGGFETAIQRLNSYRRKIRRRNQDNLLCPVIFNDYMNSLMGDPTTAKELPMIDRAAEAGCEYYVIDCGWYSDGYWWDNVGEWQPSKERFPEGISYLMDYIRKKGMVPGLWLEIEVMGINSELANTLPDDWFICRHGKRIKDHSRYHLDFRNPEVQKYASAVIERLVNDYQAGYIKMDYNTPTGIGSDLDADSFSDALLEHNRAYIQWLDQVFMKYPELIIENCGSGGMRHDYTMLARHSIQSVTDQTNYLRNGAIAAASATGITPEQAAVWSYPLTAGDTEEVIFNMVNTLLFRIHQSGHLAELDEKRFALVKEGITVYRRIRKDIPQAEPRWFTGIPHLDDEWFSFALETKEAIYLAVWRTESLDSQFSISLPEGVQSAEQLYPLTDSGQAAFSLHSKKLLVAFKHNKMARLYKLTKEV